MKIDLHVHTTASDGQYSPVEVVALARGMDLIAITDHDTTGGLAEAEVAARAQGTPILLPGVELSTVQGADHQEVHLLGYAFDLADAPFQAALVEFRESRLERGRQIVNKLGTLGLSLDYDRVLAIADGGSVGRPHIARAMLEAGYVENVKDAFNRYIGNDGPAYVARARLTTAEAIDLLHAAGGVAVLGHPALSPDWRGWIDELIAAGLDGVEITHPSNDGITQMDLRAVAKRHDLILTGGSDFHGERVKPGNTLGGVTPPIGAVAAIKARAERYKRKN